MIFLFTLLAGIITSTFVLLFSIWRLEVQKKEHISFFFYVFGIFLWSTSVLFNLLQESGVTQGYGTAMYFSGQISYFGAALSLFSSVWFFLFYKEKKYRFHFFHLLVSLFFLLVVVLIFWKDTLFYTFFLTTDYTIIIERAAWIPAFSLYVFFFYFLNLSIVAWRRKRVNDTILREQFTFLFWLKITTFGLATLTNWILPAYFSYPNLMLIGPSLFSLETLMLLYIITHHRFLDIRLNLTGILRVLLSFLAGVLVFYVSQTIQFFLFEDRNIFMAIWSLVLFALTFSFLQKFLSSPAVYAFFRHFRNYHTIDDYRVILEEFQEKATFYTSLEDFKADIRETFCQKLRLTKAEILLLGEGKELRKHYPKLVAEIEEKRQFLVTKEILFEEQDPSYLAELKKLGEVCFPIFHENNKDLIGLFVLGEKPFDDPYGRKELELLDRAAHYIALALSIALYNIHLQKEIDKKTKDLQDQNKSITQLLQQQSDFIATVAHELRTPLNIALYRLQDILRSYQSALVGRKDMETVTKSLENLNELTNRMFDVQQYDMETLEPMMELLSLQDFLREIFEEFTPLMEEKEIHFSAPQLPKKPIILKIDRNQVRQVFHNLLTNARKFTPKEGSISLSLERNEKGIYLKVADTGKGIPEKMKTKIFEKFSTEKKQPGGLGLGLYLARKIMELHGGEISVMDNSIGGSVFVLFFPKELLET